MKTIRLVMIGVGNVGRAFLKLISEKKMDLATRYGIQLVITGVSTGHHGCATNPDGIDPGLLMELARSNGDLTILNRIPGIDSSLTLIDNCPGDILLENTPVNHDSGQPAIEHLKRGFEQGMHGITANKGPVVHGFSLLTALAKEKRRAFRFESAVMDGAPIFSLHRYCLPASQLLGFHGILNSCTNLLLTRMESGQTLDEAIHYAQSIGITETDPSADIDGWDAAIKVAALSTVLMDHPLLPKDVEREGIRGITPEKIELARAEGKRWKMICTAKRTAGVLRAIVAPGTVGPDSPLYAISGTSSYIEFEMDSLPGLGIVENNPGPETTAYGLLSDLINVATEEDE